jgi:hypothetical protein
MAKLFVPTPDVVEVTFEHFGYNAKNMCHVLHFLNASPPTTEDQVNSFIFELSNWYATQVMPFLCNQVQFDTATCLPIDEDGLFQTVDHAHIVHGGYSGLMMPNKDALNLELLTTVPGRAGRGRKIISGIPRSVVVGNEVTLQWAILVRDAWRGLITFAANQGWEWVVLSKEDSGAPRSAGVVSAIVDVDFKWLRVTNRKSRSL